MERLVLEVSLREGTGKGVARKLRSAGRVPAVFYGHGIAPVHLQIDVIPLERVVHRGANALIDLQGPEQVVNKPVLVKELQRDPATRKPLHCDLFAVDLEEQITVDVPFHFVGRPRGVVEQGGVLEPLLRELEVSCMPLAIPDSIEIDVSALEIHDSVHVRDVALPEGVVALVDADQTVVHVVPPRVEEVAEEAAEEAAAEVPAAEGEPESEASAEESGDS